MIGDFHFLRPLWLLSILPWLWIGWRPGAGGAADGHDGNGQPAVGGAVHGMGQPQVPPVLAGGLQVYLAVDG